MYNLKVSLLGSAVKLENGAESVGNIEVVLDRNKVRHLIVSNDLYLSFPHIRLEFYLDNISMSIHTVKIELDNNYFKREWICSVYSLSLISNKDLGGNVSNIYVIKALSVPLDSLQNFKSGNYNNTPVEIIKSLFLGTNDQMNINVKSKLNTSGLNWNRINMNDVQFFNFLKDKTCLVNDADFIPLFYLSDVCNVNVSKKILKLENYQNLFKSDLKYEVNFSDIRTTDTIMPIINYINRPNFVHNTNGEFFVTLSGTNRKDVDNFNESVITEYVKSPQVAVSEKNSNKLKRIFQNSTEIIFDKITNKEYLPLFELGNVFVINDYKNNNKENNLFFKIAGYELELSGAESDNIIKGRLIANELNE